MDRHVEEMLEVLAIRRDQLQPGISTEALCEILLAALKLRDKKKGERDEKGRPNKRGKFSAYDLMVACENICSRSQTDRFIDCASPYLLNSNEGDLAHYFKEMPGQKRTRRSEGRLREYWFQPRSYWLSFLGRPTQREAVGISPRIKRVKAFGEYRVVLSADDDLREKQFQALFNDHRFEKVLRQGLVLKIE
jgi:hypothetical protein